ncbi:hypothetical protein TRFO_39266 [Tritrichomonas foetus]|uniref:BEACH domain-containing protein n=1 Tax=Tritrichomonas foetus TaxID=1144522 RepID=A0A1J4JAV0_9EUKA|nr:hypothetical protein TRFO_39266 [Tritrichomonas foetus]|eukprot:OHS94557.1 hypothetical protein TRFO_39266 [Tritrichomonas foetus]
MDSILTPQLISEIFTIRLRFSSVEIDKNSDLLQFISNSELPKYSPHEIKQILDPGNKNETPFNILRNIGYDFKYNPSILEQISNLSNINQPTTDYLAIFVLHSFLSWELLVNETNEFTEFPPLVKSLIWTSNSQFHGIINQAINISICGACERGESSKIYEIIPFVLDYSKSVNCQNLLVYILGYISHDLYDDRNNTYIKNMSKLLDFDQSYFSDDSILQIIQILAKQYVDLDITSLKFITKALTILPEKCANFLIPVFPDSILNLLRKYNVQPIKFDLPPHKEPAISENMKTFGTAKGEYEFFDVQTIPEGFDPYFSMQFPKIMELSNFFPKNISKTLSLIVKCIKNDDSHIEMFISNFFNKIIPVFETTINTQSNNKEHDLYINMYIALLYIWNEISHNSLRTIFISSENASHFFISSIFNYSETVFNPSKDFDKINTIRAHALDCILSDDGSTIDSILSSDIMRFPNFAAELFLRLSNVTVMFAQCIKSNIKLVKTIINLALSYQHLELNILEGIDIQAIRNARISIFVTLAHLFSDQNMLKIFFDNALFLNSFFVFLFEEPVRPFVLSSLISYLTKIDTSFSLDIPSFFFKIINMIDLQLPGQRQMLLLYDLISALDEGLTYHQKDLAQFKDMCNILCQTMAKLENDELSKNIFKVTVNFLVLMSPFFDISALEIDALISCLTSFHDPEFVESLYNSFVSLLAGQQVAPNSPNFIICQPQVLKLLIQVLSTTPKLKDIIQFCYDLCEFSPQNLERCCDIKLDLFILKYLEKTKRTGEMDNQLVQQFIDLYSLLSLHHSSAQSVLRYISLLSPIDSTHVSKYHLKFIDSIDQMVIESSKLPRSTFPLNHKTMIVDSKNDFSGIENGFAITFWIFMESNVIDCRRIFTLTVGDQMEIGVLLSNNNLYVFHYEGLVSNEPTTSLIGESLKMHAWTFCVLCFSPTGKRIFVHYLLKPFGNEKKKNKIAIENFEKPIDPSKSLLKLGGYHNDRSLPLNDNVLSSLPCRLGAFGVYKNRNADDFMEIASLGLRNNSNPSIPPIAYVNDYSEFDETMPHGFVDVLADQCGVNTILPLFLQTNLKTFDEQPFNLSLEIILTLLMHVLTYSIDAQISFYQSKGFNIIAQLLTERWTPFFTMKTNNLLFQLLLSIQCEQLQQQIFDEVMTNFTFMQLLDPDLHLRIVKHWQSLFASFPNIAQNFSSFEDIVAVMRLFYWYTPAEPLLIRYIGIRQDSLNVEEIRRLLFNLLFRYATESFQQSHLQCIVAHCVSCTEIRQVREMVSFLTKVFVETPKTIEFNVECEYLIVLLHYFIKFPDDELRIQVLHLLLVAHQVELISDEFFQKQIDVILSIFPTHAIKRPLFDFLVENLESEPLLLNLCCFLALHFKDSSFMHRKVVRKHISPIWAVGPLCVALYVDKTVTSFIFECGMDDLCDILVQYDIFFERDDEFEAEVAEKLLEMSDDSTLNLIDIFELCQRLILFATTTTTLTSNLSSTTNQNNDDEIDMNNVISLLSQENETLIHTNIITSINERENVNNHDNENECEKGKDDENLELAEFTMFFNQLKQKKYNSPQMKFQLKFDRTKWLHKNLSIKCLSLLEKKFMQQFLPFDLLLCSFLQTTDFDGVYNHLNSINLTEKDTSECEHVVLPLLNYHTIHAHKKEYLKQQPFFNPLLYSQKFELLVSQVSPKLYHKKLQTSSINFEKYRNEIKEATKNVLDINISQYIIAATKQLKQFLERQQFQNDLNVRSWKRLWSALSIERAPWHIPCKSNAIFYRDVSACYSLAPIKMIKKASQNDSSNIELETFSKRGLVIDSLCTVVTVEKKLIANFELYDNYIKIIFRENGNKVYTIHLSSLTFVFKRPNNGIHFFTELGLSFHLLFHSPPDKILETIYSLLPVKRSVIFQRCESKKFFNILPYTSSWKLGKLSNYEYLLIINHFAGRSFNDLSTYPVFPWVLNNYSSDVVNSTDNYRNFHSSILIDNKFPQNSPIHILHFLNNVEPFKSLNKKYLTESSSHEEVEVINNTETEFNPEVDNYGNLDNNTLCLTIDDYKRYAISNGCELIPEFYSMPELFKNKYFVLPKWAESHEELIYKHRKILESDQISHSINEWIDSVFGRGSPFELFDTKHPQIEVVDSQRQPVFKRQLEFPTNATSAVACLINEEKPLIFTLLILLSDGKIGEVTLNLRFASSSTSTLPPSNSSGFYVGSNNSRAARSSFSRSNAQLSKVTSTDSVRSTGFGLSLPNATFKQTPLQNKSVLNHNSCVFATNDGKFIVSNQNQSQVYVFDVNTQKLIDIDLNSTDINSVTSDGIWLATGSDNASISLVRNYKNFTTIQLYRDAITACAVSQTFGIVVSGTRGGTLIICSTANGSLFKVISLDDKNEGNVTPIKILITQSWGFIVVYCTEIVSGIMKHFFNVFTVNGDLIRKTEILIDVNFMYSWTSFDGFDYIVYTSESGYVCFDEVFYLKQATPLYNCRAKIISIFFSKETSTLVLVSNEGKAIFLPIVFNQ